MAEFNPTPPNLQRPSSINTSEPSTVPTEPSNVPQGSAPARTKTVTRDRRKPFGSQVQKLAYEARVGYHRHWFNDSPGRIETALEAGYTHVEDKDGKKVSRVVGISPGGGPQMGFLMEVPQEWYDEDMARQAAVNAEREAAIRSGSVNGQPGKDGVYVPPSRGIKITSGR